MCLSVSKSLCSHSVVSAKLLSLLCERDWVRVHVPQLKLLKSHRYRRKFKCRGMAMNCLYLTRKRLKMSILLDLSLTIREDWIEPYPQTIVQFPENSQTLTRCLYQNTPIRYQCREGTTACRDTALKGNRLTKQMSTY